MPKSATVPLSELQAEPYASVVCYPRATPAEMQVRLEELEKLGVEAIEFTGATSAHVMQVYGKGYVGIVVVAQVAGRRLALKMQRCGLRPGKLRARSRTPLQSKRGWGRPKVFGGYQAFPANGTHRRRLL